MTDMASSGTWNYFGGRGPPRLLSSSVNSPLGNTIPIFIVTRYFWHRFTARHYYRSRLEALWYGCRMTSTSQLVRPAGSWILVVVRDAGGREDTTASLSLNRRAACSDFSCMPAHDKLLITSEAKFRIRAYLIPKSMSRFIFISLSETLTLYQVQPI